MDYPRAQQASTAQARQASQMDQTRMRLEALGKALNSLDGDLADRLIAARSHFEHPRPAKEESKVTPMPPSGGPLDGQMNEIEQTIQSLVVKVAGFRELFG